jgi:hypothetical protein
VAIVYRAQFDDLEKAYEALLNYKKKHPQYLECRDVVECRQGLYVAYIITDDKETN